MKTELAVSATENFITENGQLLVIISTVKSDGQLVLISVGFSTCNKLTVGNDKVMGIDGHVLLITELDSTFNND